MHLDIINDLYNVFLLAQISMTRSRQRMTDREICEAVTISQATVQRFDIQGRQVGGSLQGIWERNWDSLQSIFVNSSN
jgi:hypothetical protein